MNRKGNSAFAKSLFDFIEGSRTLNYEGDLFSEENCVSNDSTFSKSDVKKALKDISISNMK